MEDFADYFADYKVTPKYVVSTTLAGVRPGEETDRSSPSWRRFHHVNAPAVTILARARCLA
jgi:hypothetical protein